MYIEYQKLTVRTAGIGDSAMLARWWNNGKIMAHAGYPRGLNITQQKVAEEIRSNSLDYFERLIIEYNRVPIGEMSYRDICSFVAEIGIKICDFNKQDKGLGRLYLSLLIEWLFDRGYKKIVLDTDVKNTRAQHVYELLGFRMTKINVNSWTNQLGESCSSVNYELTTNNFNNFLN